MIGAARSGDAELLQKLFEQGNNPSLKDDSEMTPLHCAVEHGHVDCVNYLLRPCMKQYRLTRILKCNLTPLAYACQLKVNIDIIQALLEADYGVADLRALNIACNQSRSDILELLVDAVAKTYGISLVHNALVFAAQKGSVECLKMSLCTGANISHLNEVHILYCIKSQFQDLNVDMNRAALHLSTHSDSESRARLLLDFMCKEEINITEELSNPVLCYAASTNNMNLLEIFLAKGANPHIQDLYGDIPIAYTDDYECAEFLLKAMDPNHVFPIKRWNIFVKYTPIAIVKLICGTFPELYAPGIFDFMLHKWDFFKEECINIIQLLLSQISLNDGSEDRDSNVIRISPSRFCTEFVEILETFSFYGQDVVVCLNHLQGSLCNLPHAMTLCIDLHCERPYPVAILPILRTLLSANPTYNPEMLMDTLEHHYAIDINLSEIPSSWDLKKDDFHNCRIKDTCHLNEGVHSLKSLARDHLRKLLADRGFISHRNFTKSLEQLGLPKYLQMYIRYLND